ncbi:MAG: hypothetical protein ACRDOO_05210 [Actinomadura sp.]
MYAWIWRHLPGTPAVKAALAALLVLIVAVVLWYTAFPWVEPKIRFDHGVVEGGTTAPATPRP